MRKTLGLSLILLAGCATQKNTYLPDGSTGHSINCSGTAASWNQCYEAAGQLCKSAGYEVISKDEQKDAVLTFAGTTHRTLLVKCK